MEKDQNEARCEEDDGVPFRLSHRRGHVQTDEKRIPAEAVPALQPAFPLSLRHDKTLHQPKMSEGQAQPANGNAV